MSDLRSRFHQAREHLSKFAYGRRLSSSYVESMADRLILVQSACRCLDSVGHMDEIPCLFSIPVDIQGFSKRDSLRELRNHSGVLSRGSTGSVDIHKTQ